MIAAKNVEATTKRLNGSMQGSQSVQSVQNDVGLTRGVATLTTSLWCSSAFLSALSKAGLLTRAIMLLTLALLPMRPKLQPKLKDGFESVKALKMLVKDYLKCLHVVWADCCCMCREYVFVFGGYCLPCTYGKVERPWSGC